MRRKASSAQPSRPWPLPPLLFVEMVESLYRIRDLAGAELALRAGRVRAR